MIGIYVNDLPLACNNTQWVEEFKRTLDLFTYPSVGLLMDTFVRYTPGESWPSTYRCLL
jgi:hydroxylamine reductase (hybrid-cluster protein)